MKKILLLSTLISTIALQAQTITDSVSMGTGNPSYPFDVFYNVETGAQDTVSNTNWHIAFAVRSAQPPMNVARAASVRLNGARGVEAYALPAGQNWSNIDTANWKTWKRLIDSDTSWDIGALNDGHNVAAFNFGWGTYSMVTRHIDATKDFLIRIVTTSGGGGPGNPPITTSMFKKLRVIQLSFDTTWFVTFANLDGGDSTYFQIKKADFAGKLFAYYNLNTKTILNREPSTPWHLVWTRYFANVRAFGIDTSYNVTGILQHPSVRTARVSGIPTAQATFADAATRFSNNINTIGWDWKVSPMGPPSTTPWQIVDSLSYFVSPAGRVDSSMKIVFTRFVGPNDQITVFNKTWVVNPNASVTSVQTKQLQVSVFPNPATDKLNIELPEMSETAIATLVDIMGRVVSTAQLLPGLSTTIEVNNLKKGIYFVKVSSANASDVVKVMVQ
jgi:hypothetical protein